MEAYSTVMGSFGKFKNACVPKRLKAAASAIFAALILSLYLPKLTTPKSGVSRETLHLSSPAFSCTFLNFEDVLVFPRRFYLMALRPLQNRFLSRQSGESLFLKPVCNFPLKKSWREIFLPAIFVHP